MLGTSVPRAGGGGNRQSAFGKAYQPCSPCPVDPLNSLGCVRFLRILSSNEVCRGGGTAPVEEGRAQRAVCEVPGGGLSPRHTSFELRIRTNRTRCAGGGGRHRCR